MEAIQPDALKKERENFFKVCREKEAVEISLLREQLTVEKHVREFSRLQGLLAKKDRLEQRLSDVAAHAGDSGSSAQKLLQDKKTKIVVEIRRKVLYRDVAIQSGESFTVRAADVTRSKSALQSAPPPSLPKPQKSLRLDCGCVTELGTLKLHLGCRYHQAVEKLRRELRAQDAATSSSRLGRGRSAPNSGSRR